jgi:putative PIN family toxin of toxin-antitoxin system
VRVVLDTNIWISSLLLPKSIPGRIITAWQHAMFDVVISTPILEELRKVLEYPKIKKRLSIPPNEIDEYLTFIRFFAQIIELKSDIIGHYVNEIRDISDVSILATLIESKADYLVTGDQDLLILNKHYPVITPSSFAEFLD